MSQSFSKRVELKRKEHERQRVIQRKIFEEQMRVLEEQQQQELLSLPIDGSALQQFAASAPTTPPRVNAILAGGERSPHAIARGHTFDSQVLPAPLGLPAHARGGVHRAGGKQLHVLGGRMVEPKHGVW